MAHQRLEFKSRDEWLKARELGIGASDVAAIVGLNPYETPYQLWCRKLGITPPKEYTFAMRAGHYLEDAVAKFFQDQTGNEIIKSSSVDFMFVNPDKDFLRVSPDRTYWLAGLPHSEANKGILECKTTQKTIDENDLPKHWLCQLMMNLGVAEMERGSLAWLTAGRTFGCKELKFVPDFYQWLVEETERFWVDNILGKKEPDAINIEDIVTKYARHTDGLIIEADPETYQAYLQLKEVRNQIAALEEQKEEYESQIKMKLQDAEALSWQGQTIATWKAPKPSKKFNQKRFQAENPELAELYMETVEASRRFLLKNI